MSRTEIALTGPVDVNGERVSSLRMRRPKVRDQRDAHRAADNDADREIRLFANLCEVAPEVIEELDLGDYRLLQDAFSDFVRG